MNNSMAAGEKNSWHLAEIIGIFKWIMFWEFFAGPMYFSDHVCCGFSFSFKQFVFLVRSTYKTRIAQKLRCLNVTELTIMVVKEMIYSQEKYKRSIVISQRKHDTSWPLAERKKWLNRANLALGRCVTCMIHESLTQLFHQPSGRSIYREVIQYGPQSPSKYVPHTIKPFSSLLRIL